MSSWGRSKDFFFLEWKGGERAGCYYFSVYICVDKKGIWKHYNNYDVIKGSRYYNFFFSIMGGLWNIAIEQIH